MYSFKSFLKEEAEEGSKLKHITHAEDRPLQEGSKGFLHTYNALMQAHNHIKSGSNSSALTMKYDGSPSVVFGHHPETGKFFVASKSAFNKNPKLNYNHRDILKNHGHAPGLMEKLHAALNHLKKIAPKTGVYQGDLMFTDEDKKHDKRGGVSFTPNTITYTARGDEAEKIARAKLGVVVHTQYHGDTVKEMKSDSHPDTHNFAQHPDVWMRSANLNTKHVHYSDEDQKAFESALTKAKHIHDKYGKEMYAATKPHQGVGGHLESYINSTVRSGEKPSSEGLKEFIASKYQKKIKDLKTPAAQGRKQAELQQHHSYIDKNKKHYDHLLKMHGYLQEAKNKLVSVLNQHEGGLEHHINGKRTDPEGFVFHPTKTKDTDGSPIKLVNRAEFSRANLLKVR